MGYPESQRDNLPAKEAFPVQRSALDDAFVAAGVEDVDLVYFMRAGIEDWHASRAGDVLRIDFCAATRDGPERIEVRVHAVPSALASTIRRAVEEAVALRAAAMWIRGAETAMNVWRSRDHALLLSWDGAELRVREREVPGDARRWQERGLAP